MTARDEFERFKIERPETLTDIQRAVRFYYLLKCGFSSKIVAPTFGVSATRAPRMNLLRIEEELSEAHLRLSRAYIENLPYARLIERFDRAGTFFYIDPPYYDCEDYYGKGIFLKDDFTALASLLSTVKGKFIVSLNDTSEIRRIYKAFRIETVTTSYTIGGGNKKKTVSEVLIRNF